ncbi:MAG TPA: SAM-dependent methyltransferase [Beijerinckiaceae bacterium]
MTALAEEIKALIAAEGPIGLDRYMALCLAHPVHGYYVTRDPLGAGGDFTTAPEISQMFGELIGLWIADTWTRMGSPGGARLVELGPGRGTLMADALRALRVVPAFLAAASVHLVEMSPILREKQATSLAASPCPVSWHDTIDAVPAGPMIVVANEFFDALPIRQFVFADGWRERLVGLSDDALAFGLAAEPEPALSVAGRPGEVIELHGAGALLAASIAARLADQGGAALIIDYGHLATGRGDTFQAVREHAFVDPLAEPGEADLTVHVDFEQLRRAARAARAHGPLTQRDLLLALGIEARAERLKARATPPQAAAIDAALARLTDPTPTGMGALFKALALSRPDLTDLPGFSGA